MQVRNLSGCIKMASDFVDPWSVVTSANVAQCFQQDKLEDVLLLKHVLWHAWHSVAHKLPVYLSMPDGSALRKQQKKARQRLGLAARNYRAE